MRRVQITQGNLGLEARADHADADGDVCAVTVFAFKHEVVTTGNDRRQRLRVEQGIEDLLRRSRNHHRVVGPQCRSTGRCCVQVFIGLHTGGPWWLVDPD
ncbi:hypothetical protein D3C72_1725660 [compost metagenome]